ncbi:MAG TPA: hypothetical protein VNR89_17625 [Roseomonas sp.]|nr:hypothetical protein [Roseomonas sp.]
MRHYDQLIGRATGILEYLDCQQIAGSTEAVYRSIYGRYFRGALPAGVSPRQRRPAILWGSSCRARELLPMLQAAVDTEEVERSEVIAAELEAVLAEVIEHSQGRPGQKAA